MALRHPVIRGTLAVTGVLRNVLRADDTLTPECRPEYGRVARHRKTGECLSGNTRQRVKRIALACLVDDVVEESPELGSGQLDTRIRGRLNKLLKIEFGCE